MEKVRSMGWVLTGLMVLGMLAGEANASFKSCYESCFLLCLITPNNSAFSCSYKCLKDCIIPSFKQTETSALLPEDDSESNNNIIYFCKLGCASSFCANFSTKHNPRSGKVESCVNSCSDTCTKN